jgi:hypothetical protein
MEFGEKLEQMFSEAVSEIGQELGRMGVQGQAELASALFTGNAYVPYGQGQNRPSAEHGMEGLHSDGKEEIQHENEGRSM